MKVTRPRVRVLAGVFGAVLAVEVLHLLLLMTEQHELWLERSFSNRWAFRDVPPRRGSILDRRGVVLAEDRPSFVLLARYRSFRRRHAAGAALHGANLVMKARGIGDDVYGYLRPGRGPREAFATLMRVPLAWSRQWSEEIARDVRFYMRALVRGLTEGERRARALRRLRRPPEEGGRDLLAVCGFASLGRAEAAFARRLHELEDLDRRLRAAGNGGLWRFLEARRRERWARPRAEHVPRTLRRALPFELAARIEIRRERFPGLWLRPSVERAQGSLPGRDGLGSLRPVIGMVTPFWREDRDDIDGLVEEVLDPRTLQELVPDGTELPEELRPSVERDLQRAVRLYYAHRGRLGRGGVEGAYHETLSGVPGLRWVERARGTREQGQWSDLSVTPGEPVRLTIDARLQAVLERVLDRAPAERETAVAVVDPRTGGVLALGGRPLERHGRRLWINPAVTWGGVGYLGSVAKTFVLLEQLDAARRGRPHRPHADFAACTGRYRTVRGAARALTCLGAHGDVAGQPARSLAKSCNFFYFQTAEGLGEDGLARAYARVGLMPSGGSTVGERRYQSRVRGLSGLGRAGMDGGGHALQERAIGYGLQASALHVARAYGAIATGSLPRLRLALADPRAAVPLGVHEADLEVVREGLRMCVLPGGTAGGLTTLAELGVLGKTGTAEVTTDRRNNAWFAGYLTRARPTLAFAAVVYAVEHGAHGGEVAGGLVAAFLAEVRADDGLRSAYLADEEGR